jgi:hypothetical protein
MPENIVAILRTAEEAELRYLRATLFIADFDKAYRKFYTGRDAQRKGTWA